MVRSVVRTARKHHQCGSCLGPIKPGERYLSGIASPGSDLGNDFWWRLAECGECAERRGRSLDPQPVKEAV